MATAMSMSIESRLANGIDTAHNELSGHSKHPHTRYVLCDSTNYLQNLQRFRGNDAFIAASCLRNFDDN